MSKYSLDSFDEELLTRLQDPTKSMEIWQWLNSASPFTLFTPGRMFPSASTPHFTPSGMDQGAQSSSSGALLVQFPPMWWPPFCTSSCTRTLPSFVTRGDRLPQLNDIRLERKSGEGEFRTKRTVITCCYSCSRKGSNSSGLRQAKLSSIGGTKTGR